MKILKFSAFWCAPCKMLANQLKDYTAHTIENYDFDANPEVFQKYGVQKLPTVIAIDTEGKELGKFTGPKTTTEFESWIKEITDEKLDLPK